MRLFQPDLIIEVTSACNRACTGCYAPNVVTNVPSNDFYKENPELFIGISALNRAFNHLDTIPYLTTVRGGEPSLHPKLAILLLMIQRHSSQIMLETHGRWLLPEKVSDYQELIEAIRSLSIIVKVSFDKMHKLSTESLNTITDFLEASGIDYRIAITEDSIGEFIVTKTLCSWIDDSKIIFQQKASSVMGLVQPTLGVINTKGEFQASVTSHFSYNEAL
ncbi:MAG TPA: hypothetical protein VNJ08_14425 [Bacteriovoracaceae bacterium]|nr:hypothetical protein [Bacteriovoracaceae bacterium]